MNRISRMPATHRPSASPRSEAAAPTGATDSADMRFFSLLVQTGSLAAAARELQVTPPAVSKRLALLEQRLGVRLLNRTTRRMALTSEGELYLSSSRRILAEIETLERQLQGTADEPRGLLRVNATLGFGRLRIAPLIASFVQRWPQVEVQLQLSASPPPLSDDAFDVCVRFGPPPDARVLAWLLAPNRRLLCASPGYLARHGTPRTPGDLRSHRVIGIRQGDEGHGVWRLSRGAQHETVKLHGGLSTNDGEIAVQWALAGHGIVMRAEWDVADHLRSGRLRQVLPQWSTPPADIHVVVPKQLQGAARVRAFVEHLRANLHEPAAAPRPRSGKAPDKSPR